MHQQPKFPIGHQKRLTLNGWTLPRVFTKQCYGFDCTQNSSQRSSFIYFIIKLYRRLVQFMLITIFRVNVFSRLGSPSLNLIKYNWLSSPSFKSITGMSINLPSNFLWRSNQKLADQISAKCSFSHSLRIACNNI